MPIRDATVRERCPRNDPNVNAPRGRHDASPPRVVQSKDGRTKVRTAGPVREVPQAHTVQRRGAQSPPRQQRAPLAGCGRHDSEGQQLDSRSSSLSTRSRIKRFGPLRNGISGCQSSLVAAGSSRFAHARRARGFPLRFILSPCLCGRSGGSCPAKKKFRIPLRRFRAPRNPLAAALAAGVSCYLSAQRPRGRTV
jgi:hypothetical protein